MALFGSSWKEDNNLEGYYDYDKSILHRSDEYNPCNDYDKPVCPPVHLDEYDRKQLENQYEPTIKHFKD